MLKFFNNIDRFVHRMLEAMCSLFLACDGWFHTL